MTNLVVTCAKRKSLAVADGLHFGTVFPQASLEERASVWLRRLREYHGRTRSAAEMYVGEQWSVIRDFMRETDQVRLWVCSAGYGLVPGAAELAPYSATFSTDHPDAVVAPGLPLAVAQRAWWRALSTPTEDHPCGAPYTLERVAREYPGEPLLIAASPVYLRAMREDLLSAGCTLSDPEFLSVFSAGADRLVGAERHLVTFDARLRQKVGGSMMSLNVRVFREAFRHTRDLRTSTLREVAESVAYGVPALVTPRRTPMTDGEVNSYLDRELGADPAAGWSTLHRRLRHEENRACEQKRFRKLYQQRKVARTLRELAGLLGTDSGDDGMGAAV